MSLQIKINSINHVPVNKSAKNVLLRSGVQITNDFWHIDITFDSLNYTSIKKEHNTRGRDKEGVRLGLRHIGV